MIGPSPDWFVGVSGRSLLDGSDWRSSYTVDLFPYDAGTEDGENFSLSNDATDPQGTITSIRGQGKFSNTRMARLSFTLNQDNAAPEFSGTSTTRSFAETVGDATVQSAGNVGVAVSATDQDNDTLAYSLEGTDAGKFTIVSGSGQILTKVGESYDRETKASYSVMVKADDSNGGTDTIAVTVTVTDVEEKPLAPAAPSVSAASATSVNVMWNAPSNTGRPAITSYDLQYRQGMTGSWTDGLQDVASTSSEIMNLVEDTEYQVQVRASNSDGDGTWSEPGTGRTNVQGNRVPVPSPPPEEETEEEVEERCAVENPEIDPAQLRGILRQEGPWREGGVYIYIMDETGRVIFDGADRSRKQKDEYGKQYVRDLIAEAGEGIVEYTEGGLLRRGYAVRVEVPLDEEESSRVYVVGSGYRVEEQPDMEEQPGESGNGGGGCGSVGAFSLFLAALALLLTVSLKRHPVEDKTH